MENLSSLGAPAGLKLPESLMMPRLPSASGLLGFLLAGRSGVPALSSFRRSAVYSPAEQMPQASF
jgi:hypothetical protein